jgi:hypothetical protein
MKNWTWLLLGAMVSPFASAGPAAPADSSLQLGPDGGVIAGIYRGQTPLVKFDTSPKLSAMPVIPVYFRGMTPEREKEDQPSGLEWIKNAVPQLPDARRQTNIGPLSIPAPGVSFDGQPNVAGVNPPDPSGDVGPSHYVAVSNSSLQIFSKTGTSLFGPANINTLWAGFGGSCQTENAGDPVVLYDQIADRWLITQFTSKGPIYFNCVAISQTPDPVGAYYRYAFTTGTNFPDYPKYGMWLDSYLISTREFAGAAFAGVGAYALNRADMLAGNPTPRVVSFIVPPGAAPFNTGDGLLPVDIDGQTLPPAGTPAYYVGSMDAGGPYSAPQDALTLWKLVIDYATPALSSFTLANTIPIATFDTVYPCTPSARECLPQSGTTVKVDILSYRQRPLNRLAYRNFGTYESLVTNQSVEAAPNMAGVRWWEIRSPNSAPVIFQEGTYAPGVTDGIHRWMASVAMDSAGNMGMGYNATSGTMFPSIYYTGRLASDPLGTLPQGEGTLVAGTGANTGGGSRWGDYTSLNVDPTDDCTFWYVSQYTPVTSASGWRLRIGSFRFNECGTPTFSLASTPTAQTVCVKSGANFAVNLGGIAGFTTPVNLSATGQPAGVSVGYLSNPAAPGGISARVDVGPAAAAGTYPIALTGTSGATIRTSNINVTVQNLPPAAPALSAPANAASNQTLTPTLSWAAVPQTSTYLVEISTSPTFAPLVFQQVVTGTTLTTPILLGSTNYFWRVSARNSCPLPAGPDVYFQNGFEDARPGSATSAAFTFTTQPGPGDCPTGTTGNVLFSEDMESGAPGWTHSAAVGTDSWAISNAFPATGINAYRGIGPISRADQRLQMPAVNVPAGSNSRSLVFSQKRGTENNGAAACFDGGYLEASTDGGATFTAVTAGITGVPYNGPLPAANPGGAAQAWCGSFPHALTAVDLAPYGGQSVIFRFRLTSDASISLADGWNIDNVRVQSCN